MRRYGLFLLCLVWLTACTTTTNTTPPPGDTPSNTSSLQTQIDKYVSATSASVEQEVLNRLKSDGVTPEQVRTLLKKQPVNRTGQAGTFFNLPVNSDGRKYNYSLYAPKMKPGKTYPVVIILHGAGGSGKTTLSRWIKRLGSDFIIACPSYPLGAWWSFKAEAMVFNLLLHLKSQYPVDDNRVLLAGLSNGAVGAYMIGMFYPDYFAGIIPIAGTINERYMNFLVNLVNTPLYSIQGEHDPIFPIKYSRRIKEILTTMKYPAVLREHSQKTGPHGGHFLPESEIPPLVSWMKRQRRVNDPKVVRLVRETNHMGPAQWARVSRGYKLAALQIPGPEKETLRVQDGKIATLIAIRKDKNQFEIQGKNMLENELLLNSDLVDYSKPLKVTFVELIQEKKRLTTKPRGVVFEGMVKPSLKVLLQGFKKRRDPNLLYDVILPISVEEKVQVAAVP